ncbi:ABC transporter G family member 37-like [Hibiscus syriacus]|uniref:ABC transporter G family member 37-like n=1 Tax=Hibiscus syriacus TaxID=106335 RepID=UPI001923611B|nr:ABC transporter G family member 37-like [Hibiscus syriacus]
MKLILMTFQVFVKDVLEIMEHNEVKDALVGIPGISGLSNAQHKRLTIAVELVANPSVIFMDEPISGLDARAAAIVMRAVKNVVDTCRTIICTIHQSSCPNEAQYMPNSQTQTQLQPDLTRSPTATEARS